MNFVIPPNDRTDFSESRDSSYYQLPTFRHDKNKEIVNKLQIINDYIKNLETKNKKNEEKLHNKFQGAKTLLKEEEKVREKRKHQQKSYESAVLLQPPSHLPNKIEYGQTQQPLHRTRDLISNQMPGSTAFSIKTLGHYSHMFTDVSAKQKNTSAPDLNEIYRTTENCVEETIRKISNLNYHFNCCKDSAEKHRLQFKLSHLANEVELKKAQLAELEKFIRKDRCKMTEHTNYGDTITTKLKRGDQVQIVTTIKSSRDHRQPLSVSHVRLNVNKPKMYHSCTKRTLIQQLKPSDLSWQ